MDSPGGLSTKGPQDGCDFCQLLHDCIKGSLKSSLSVVRFARVGSYLAIDDGREQPIANLYTMAEPQNKSLQNMQNGFPKLPDAGSETHFQILREWIRSCNDTHHCLPDRSDFVPTRLLKVSDDGSGRIWLLENTQDLEELEKYVVLSHRWGSPHQHAKFRALKSNIETLKHGFKVSSLPKTFQDAVYVTRSLGLDRLWIDSLCIIQDDLNDWETESELMERVFSSAYCTIAASCAAGSSDGFLKPRPERRCVAMQAHSDSDIKATYYVCEAIDDFSGHVDQSELNQRGWVMQERALSRRTIYFTEMQSYWECGEGVRCETMTKMKNRKASFLGDANFPHSADKYVKGMKIEFFQDLYERFSKLALSFVSDRPVAIKGLEKRLLNTFGTTGGYGVFNIYLHRSLLWQRDCDSLNRIVPARGDPVPSWSWMAHDGAIRYVRVPFGEAYWFHDVKSPFTKDLHKRENDGDNVTGENLELEAPVWGIIGKPDTCFTLDRPLHTHRQPVECIVLGRSKTESLGELQTHWVLLVHCVSSNKGAINPIYERLGVGVLDRRHIAFDQPARNGRIR